jgi:hypothetical protein
MWNCLSLIAYRFIHYIHIAFIRFNSGDLVGSNTNYILGR